jgi:hypothetical protein
MDSTVTSVKEPKGTRGINRVDICNEIRKGVNTKAQTDAIVSFAVNLLPFFQPDPAIISTTFSLTQCGDYLRTIRSNKTFSALCYYLKAMDFEFKSELKEELERMGREFAVSKDPLHLNNDPGLNTIISSIRNWRPTRGAVKVNSNTLAEQLEPVILIACAKNLSAEFEVFQIHS